MTQKIKIDRENERQQLRDRVVAFCTEAGYRLSPEADSILCDIVHMKEIAGDYYCPCQKRQTPKTVCVCQPVRNGLVDMLGACFCNLILAQKS